ncbi:MAG: sugar phosphate isomerase/epimerase [Ruminococcaceae bacterium]|nr:sugar phosphate isomerase/epimerase [Oscillospiraceae bacterium]
MKYGLQLYSVRDVAAQNFEQTLKQVAEMGYSMVETAGFFNHSAEEVKAMLTHYGLTICSTHTGYKQVFNDFENTLDYHKKVGCQNIILPGAPFSTKEELDYTVDAINRCQPIIEAEGLRLHYHNHSDEFLPNKDGLIAEEELAKRTNILFEIDTFWAFNAGLRAIDVMEKYRDRLAFIHLKDGIPQERSDPNGHAQGKSIGSGEAPIKEVRQKAKEMGLTIVVESEGLEPNGLAEVKRCIDFLKKLDAEEEM